MMIILLKKDDQVGKRRAHEKDGWTEVNGDEENKQNHSLKKIEHILDHMLFESICTCLLDIMLVASYIQYPFNSYDCSGQLLSYKFFVLPT